MSHFQRFSTPLLPRSDFQIEYGESFGLIKREPSPKNITSEREFYFARSGNVSFLIEGTVYFVEPGDVIMIAPHEFFHCIHHDNEPFRYFRILINDSFVDAAAPSLRVASLDRKARFCLSRPAQAELFETCEALLRDPTEASLFGVFRFLDILRRFKTLYTEDDNKIERYELCLPITLRKLIYYIRKNMRDELSVTSLADMVGVSPIAAGQLFKDFLHLSVHEYMEGVRLAEATHLLLWQDSVEDVARILKYKNTAYFSTVFKKHYGTTPRKYIQSQGIVYFTDL